MPGPVDPIPLLPHGAPFLLVDRVLEIGEKRGVFLKHVTGADPCVAPDGTLPAAFLLEALAQGGGALLTALAGAGPNPGYLASVDGFVCTTNPRAGDTVRIEVEITRVFAGATHFRGRALVDGESVAEGRFTLALPR